MVVFFSCSAPGLAWAFEGFEDNQLPDEQIADNALRVLDELKNNATEGDDRPFFLAVGFHKPVRDLERRQRIFIASFSVLLDFLPAGEKNAIINKIKSNQLSPP